MQPTDTEVLWLNLTNAGLGLATLAGIAALAWAVLRDLREKAKAASPSTTSTRTPPSSRARPDDGRRRREGRRGRGGKK